MSGMKGWGPSLMAHDVNGVEIIPTRELLEVFPQLDRSHLFRILTRAKVRPDPLMRGERGERFWPRHAGIVALYAWETRMGGK